MILRDALQYVLDNSDRLLDALSVHARLSVFALLIATAIVVPLGALAVRSERAGQPIVAVIGAARVVPSLAVLFLLLCQHRPA